MRVAKGTKLRSPVMEVHDKTAIRSPSLAHTHTQSLSLLLRDSGPQQPSAPMAPPRSRRCCGNRSKIEDLIFAGKQLEHFLLHEDLLFPEGNSNFHTKYICRYSGGSGFATMPPELQARFCQSKARGSSRAYFLRNQGRDPRGIDPALAWCQRVCSRVHAPVCLSLSLSVCVCV
jgi:hypothetical protein